MQDVLGVRSTATVTSAEQRSFFALLPPELSVLYVQAEAYKDIVEGKSYITQLELFNRQKQFSLISGEDK